MNVEIKFMTKLWETYLFIFFCIYIYVYIYLFALKVTESVQHVQRNFDMIAVVIGTYIFDIHLLTLTVY